MTSIPQFTPTPTPTVSVIVTAVGSQEATGRCLTSLLEQDAPAHSYEIVIVTSESPDDESAGVAEAFINSHSEHQVRLLQSRRGSVSAARNVGLDHAHGAHVLFVDSHDWVSREYISALLAGIDGVNVPLAEFVSTSTESPPDSHDRQGRAGEATGDLVPLAASAAHPARSTGKLFPRPWLDGVRFDETLSSSEDAIFNASVFRPFSRRFAHGNLKPMRAGARYHCSPSSHPTTLGDDYDTVVGQRLNVLRALVDGPDAEPEDRTGLTEVLIRRHAVALAQILNDHPQFQARAAQDLSAGRMRGVDLFTTGDDRWPGYDTLMGQPGPGPIPVALVSGTAQGVSQRSADLAFLRERDHEVVAAFLTGVVGKDFPDIEWRRLAMAHEQPTLRRRRGTQSSVRSTLIRMDKFGRKAMRRAALRMVPLTTLANFADPDDQTARALLADSTVVALDESGEALASTLGFGPQPSAWLDGHILATAAVSPKISASEADIVSRAATSLRALPADSPALPPPPVWTLASLRLIRNARRKAAREVIANAQRAHPNATATHGWDLLRLLADVLERGQLTSGYEAICKAVMDEADRLMSLGATDHSLFLIEHTIEVLLHPEVQANVADPPLIRNPDTLLAPLSEATTWRSLTGPVEGGFRVPATTVETKSRQQSVLILPGAYPKFAAPVQAALEGHADVDILRLSEIASQFGNTNPSLSLLAQRHQASSGAPLDISGDIAEAFAGKDVIFADWADKGAMLASLYAPPGARLVIRFHGVDSLSVWQFLIDWSRVTDVAFVSDHLRRTVLGHLGDRLAGVRHHVIGNVVDTERFSGESTESARRTLGLVGWGQRVKDPLWALEVLEELRAEDPSWRLKLIGADFPAQPNRISERAYATAFRKRALEPDLRSAITYVGYTSHLPDHLSDVGFALSTSLRESWHIGAMEMTAAHAVPVIRDWPAYHQHGGAGAMFPEQWVVQTPTEAAARIRAHADRATWQSAADAARLYVSENHGRESVANDYRRILLGH